MADNIFPLKTHLTCTNMNTGKSIESDFLLFPNEAKICAIVRVEKVRHYFHGDNSIQIIIDCLALDSLGNVFALDMQLNPESVEEMGAILEDLEEGQLYSIEGRLCVLQEEASITIYGAEYDPIFGVLAKNAAAVFRANCRETDC